MGKKISKYGLFAFACLCITNYGTNNAVADGCEQKIAEMNKQLSFAESAKNINETNRIKTALEKVKANCTEASISKHDDRKISKLKRKISEKKEDLAEHKQELAEAKLQNKSEKIEKYSNKIQEDQNKIDRLEKELTEHQK